MSTDTSTIDREHEKTHIYRAEQLFKIAKRKYQYSFDDILLSQSNSFEDFIKRITIEGKDTDSAEKNETCQKPIDRSVWTEWLKGNPISDKHIENIAKALHCKPDLIKHGAVAYKLDTLMKRYGVDEYDVYIKVGFNHRDVMQDILAGKRIPTDNQLGKLSHLFNCSVKWLLSYDDDMSTETTCHFTDKRDDGVPGFSGVEARDIKRKTDSFNQILSICSETQNTHCVVVKRNKKLAIVTQKTRQDNSASDNPPHFEEYYLTLEEAAEQSKYFIDKQAYYGNEITLNKKMQALCEKLIHLFACNSRATVIRNGDIYQIFTDREDENIIVHDASRFDEQPICKWRT